MVNKETYTGWSIHDINRLLEMCKIVDDYM